MVCVGSKCLNHPELVQKHPTHLASSVMVWFVHLAHCDGVVRVGLLCLNHPELEHKHPPHLSLAVMVWFV